MKDYVKIKDREINLFIYHLTQTINQENSKPFTVRVLLNQYNETVGEVYLDFYDKDEQSSNRIGKIISFFDNIKLPEDTYFYFFPDASYFDYCKMDNINLMLQMSTDLLEMFAKSSKLMIPDNNMNMLTARQFNYDISHQQQMITADYFHIKNVTFLNSSQMVFRFTNETKSGKLKPDFKMMIKNDHFTIGSFRGDIFDKLNFVLSQYGDTYTLDNPTDVPLFNRSFNTYDEFKVALDDIFSVVYYGIIFDIYSIPKPSMEEFKKNKDKYLKILEMIDI